MLVPLVLAVTGGCSVVSPAQNGLAAVAGVSQDSASCVLAFDSLRAVFRHDYPGYRDKTAGREHHLTALIDSVRDAAAVSDHHSVCIPALWRFTSFFRDPHIALWQAGPPQPPASGPPAAASEANDPRRPSLQPLDARTILLRLPSFDMAYQAAIHHLIDENRALLLRTPYLIVDVRGNGGGYTGSFGPLLPFLYSRPFLRHGVDIWTSPANVEHLRGYLTAEGVPESLRARIRAILPRLESRPNEFITFAADETIQFDTVYANPRRVAVLIDGGCASSCENFVLDARQSSKVTIMGTEGTRGMLDYGNVRSVWLPGWRRLRVPTSRARWVADSPLDGIGLAPALLIPAADEDPIRTAQTYLERTGPPE